MSSYPPCPDSNADVKRHIVLVTGQSGAGISTALKALEDAGYYAVDNLPIFLLEPLLSEDSLSNRHLAIGLDTRTPGFDPENLIPIWHRLWMVEDGVEASLLFVTCSDERLQQRFSETRRRHPLAVDRSILDGIADERGLLAPIEAQANVIIDTTTLAGHELKRMLTAQFGFEEAPGLTVFVQSFSYRKGVPRAADLVLDVRFLANPHYEPQLRELTGQDQPVAEFITNDPDCESFYTNIAGLLGPLLPRYRREGKSYLTIAFGCTGGKHRSVFSAETVGRWVAQQGYRTVITHTNIPAEDQVLDGADQDGVAVLETARS
ncbi:MAG: RNase adapter RapZ [Alphaproteobacteria bacterium]